MFSAKDVAGDKFRGRGGGNYCMTDQGMFQ